MKVPNIAAVVVPREKLTDYLLSKTHRDGRHKATFFLAMGFTVAGWIDFRAALVRHADENDVAHIEESDFGQRYVVEGPLHTPSGRKPRVRTVWFVEHDAEEPRFVTAYPLARTARDPRA